MSQQVSSCPLNHMKAGLERFYYDESKSGMCSKCHPCKLGVYNAIRIFEAIQTGRGESRHISLLRRIARDMKGGSMCKKGKDQADILSEFLLMHAEDLCRHVRGICDDHECLPLVTYEINADRCSMCDACREACPSFAVEGQKQEPYKTGFAPYRIRQKRCTHCGECLAVCPEGAVSISGSPGVRVPARSVPESPVVAKPAYEADECREVFT